MRLSPLWSSFARTGFRTGDADILPPGQTRYQGIGRPTENSYFSFRLEPSRIIIEAKRIHGQAGAEGVPAVAEQAWRCGLTLG